MNSFHFGDLSSSHPSNLPPHGSLYNYEGGVGGGGGANENHHGFEDSGDSYDSNDLSSSVSVMTDYLNQHPGLIYTYDVRFKTCTEQYLFHEKLTIGEMVTVQCERGYNIGFVDGESLSDPENPPQKRILAKLMDEDNTIKDMLKFKIIAEKNALSQCRLHCKGHRLGSFADSIAAEFQFDRKKLTVYLKKYEDVSVCRLVRKLYDTYKMRIKVLEVDDPETMKDLTKKYLDLSKLNIPLSDAFNFDPATSVLSSKNQGKQNKSEKQTPNYSKSHLGQSQHLIPSLVQYGPQADKRHNQPNHQQHFFPTTITVVPTTSIIGQPQRSDRLNNRDSHQHQSHQLHLSYGHVQGYQQQPPQLLQHHSVHSAPTFQTGPRNHSSRSNQYQHYQQQPHLSSWSSTNVNQRGAGNGNWYALDQHQQQLQDRQVHQQQQQQFPQFEKPAMHNANFYHHNLEPFGHDGSFDEAFYRRYNLNHSSVPPASGAYQGNPPTLFGEHEDYLYHGPASRRGSETSASSYDLDVLSAALSSASMDKMDKRPSNSSLSISSPSSSPTNCLIESTSASATSSKTQSASAYYRHPELSF
jgi:hypothetical protein